MTTPTYDPTSGYQPNGGWGYQEWGQAGEEAWDRAGEATANGDPTTASHWTEVAQQADQQSHDVYVAGGPGYGSGGDSSGFNDGTYWGAGAATPTEAPVESTTVDSTPVDTVPMDGAPTESATPSYYDTPADTTTTDMSAAPSYDSGADSFHLGF